MLNDKQVAELVAKVAEQDELLWGIAGQYDMIECNEVYKNPREVSVVDKLMRLGRLEKVGSYYRLPQAYYDKLRLQSLPDDLSGAYNPARDDEPHCLDGIITNELPHGE